MRVLLVNDQPRENLMKSAFKDAATPLDLVVARTLQEARDVLASDTFDIVFMDFEMGYGQNSDSVSSGLVQEFVGAGYGTDQKPLIAHSYSNNSRLEEAGCNKVCHPSDIEEFVQALCR